MTRRPRKPTVTALPMLSACPTCELPVEAGKAQGVAHHDCQFVMNLRGDGTQDIEQALGKVLGEASARAAGLNGSELAKLMHALADVYRAVNDGKGGSSGESVSEEFRRFIRGPE